MPDQYDVGNIVNFIAGFGKKRGEIAEQNQTAKNYKLQTVQTLFSFAEGKRASAESSRLLAGDANLSRNERDRHALDAERYSAEGEQIYAGASELFGLIDEKPKTGKKENPAMQFLKFVNPFTRRGNQPGEFEAELSTLLSGLGGDKGGGGAESPGFTAGGIGGGTPTGQGAGDPGQTATAAALGAAIPGTGPTPRLPAAEGPVSSAAATLAQQQQVGPPFTTSPVAGATGEAIQAGVPTATAITPTPGEEGVLTARDMYPHITGTRAAYPDLTGTDFNERINQEGQTALTNLNQYLQSTPIRETFADAMNDPEFTKHYRPAARAFQDLEAYDTFQSEIAAIFPEMRERPPEAGFALAADVARRFRIETQAGKFGDASTWSAETIAAVEAFDAWAAMQSDLSPEFGALRKYIRITRMDPSKRTPQDEADVLVFMDLYNKGLFGPSTVGGRGGGVNYQFIKGIGPDGQEVYFAQDPRNPNAPAHPLRDSSGNAITTTPNLELEDIMYTAEWVRNPNTDLLERKSWKVEPKKVIAALQRPGTRRTIMQWMATVIFDTDARREVEAFLIANPTAGLDPGEDVTRIPGPGDPNVGPGGLEAFRRRAQEREGGGGGATAPAYVPPPSPY